MPRDRTRLVVRSLLVTMTREERMTLMSIDQRTTSAAGLARPLGW